MQRRLTVVAALVLASLLAVEAPSHAAPPAGWCVATSKFLPYNVPGEEVTVVGSPSGRSWPLPQEVLAWSPDRRRTVHRGESGSVPTGALRLGTPMKSTSTMLFDLAKRRVDLDETMLPAFSPDGRRVAFVVSEWNASVDKPQLWVVDIATKKAVRVTPKNQAVVNSFAWAPDGKTLYYAVARVRTSTYTDTNQADVYVVSSSGSGTPRRIITTAYYPSSSYPLNTRWEPPAGITNLAVSPDGKTLAFVGWDFQGMNGASLDLWLADRDGTDIRQIADNSTATTSHTFPQWSSNGKRLAVSLNSTLTDGRYEGLAIIDIATTKRLHVVRGGFGYGVPAWSPEGSTVAYSIERSGVYAENDTRILDVATGRTTRVIKGIGTSPRIDLNTWVPCKRAQASCDGKPATIVGTIENDTLRGTNGNDVILALSGTDTIDGRDGKDRICGGSGTDYLTGGPGDDKLFGDADVDRLDGGPGDDQLDGGAGPDTCLASGGDRVRDCA